MILTAHVVAAAPHTGKIIKNLVFFERGENLLQNGIPNFVFRLSQLSGMAMEIYTR